MAISPYDGEVIIADEIRRTYAEAELRTIEAIAKRLRRGESDAQQWAQAKLVELRKVKGDVDKEVIEYLKNSNPKVVDAIEKAYKKGQKSGIADMNKINKTDTTQDFGVINQQAVRSLATETVTKLNSTHLRILRQTDDVYREAVAEGVRASVAGADTYTEAAQRILNQFANKGITGFQDSAGRAWNLSSYAEMAVRSASGRAAIQGHVDKLEQNNEDLVVVSDHGEECDLCRPWERRVLSISGNSKKYPSLSEARSAGLFHPNCSHTLSLYTPGLTEDVGKQKAKADPDGAEKRRKQRYQERQIRKWKRRKVAALDKNEERKAQNYISKWQKKQRDFINKTGRQRRYAREQINKAR